MKIFLDGIEFMIVHRTNRRIKRISLLLENQNEIIVKTPLGFKVHNLQKIVLAHKNWILNSIKKVPVKNSFEFVHGGHIPFVGVDYVVNFVQDNSIQTAKLVFDNNIFCMYCNAKSGYDDFLTALQYFYKMMAKKIIDPIFDELIEKTQLYPQKISYRKANKRWGSCSYNNNISINYMLLQFPLDAIRYVVLHELCHIKEKNHSKRFWNLVSFYMDDYKTKEEILKNKCF